MLLLEKESIPFKLSDETSSETNTFKKEISIDIDREVGEESPITMDPEDEGGIPPPIPFIDPLGRPRGLPIVVPHLGGGGYAITTT